MSSPDDLQALRRWYVWLLRLYPRAHRERFGEGMTQTFNDLLRERKAEGRSCVTLAVHLGVETLGAIMRARFETAVRDPRFRRPAAATSLVLTVPLVMSVIDRQRPPGDGWHWGPMDFVVMGILLFGAGFLYEHLARKVHRLGQRVALGAAVLLTLLAIWVELAVDGVSQILGVMLA